MTQQKQNIHFLFLNISLKKKFFLVMLQILASIKNFRQYYYKCFFCNAAIKLVRNISKKKIRKGCK